MANKATGAFGATGQSAAVQLPAGDNLDFSIGGTFVGTIDLERSYDKGTTWGVVNSYTAPTEVAIEPSNGLYQYRLNCSAYTSGSATYFLG